MAVHLGNRTQWQSSGILQQPCGSCWQGEMKVLPSYRDTRIDHKQSSDCSLGRPFLVDVDLSKNIAADGVVVLFRCSVMSDSLRPYGLQHARLPCPSPSLGTCYNLCPSSQWCHPTISSSVALLSPALNLSQHQGLFQWVGSSHQMVQVLELHLQHQSFQEIFRVDFL